MPAARHRHTAAARVASSAVAAALAVAVPAAEASWRPPVDDALITRAFDLGANPFEGGRHRGIDLAAPAGAAVRAPCSGEVVVAGRVGTSGRVVTVRCGVWRVSHMPLAAIVPRVGDQVDRGAKLGTAAPSHAHSGLHLGVRREGDRFGYVDPLQFLAAKRSPPPLVGGRRPPPVRITRPPRLGPAPRAPRPATPRLRRAAVGPAPSIIAREPVTVAGRPTDPIAAGHPAGDSNRMPVPWPAWLGAALILAGLGFGWRTRVRRPAGGRGDRSARRAGRPAEGIR
jgi:hypothetical protein